MPGNKTTLIIISIRFSRVIHSSMKHNSGDTNVYVTLSCLHNNKILSELKLTVKHVNVVFVVIFNYITTNEF